MSLKIKAAKLSDVILQQLENMILEGSLAPGEKLPPERELAKQFEVSRLDESKVKLSKITFVTVGYDKRDEAGIALAHDLQYTPTFIVKHNGVEVNRVVEKPSGTLAQDLTLGL